MGKKSVIPPEKLEWYQKLIDTIPEIEKKGATMAYTSLNGHMFSFMDKTGEMSLRLPKPAREEFLSTYQTKLAEQYGAVMKEYVVVPEALLEKTDELKDYFEQSHRYIQSLKPKPTKKKK